MTNFNEIWSRIEAHAGETFYQMKGGEFTYKVEGGHVYVSRTDQRIPKSHFEGALALVPLRNTVPLQEKFRGPSFIFGILMDERIKQSDW
jgi:hypothetical protein